MDKGGSDNGQRGAEVGNGFRAVEDTETDMATWLFFKFGAD